MRRAIHYCVRFHRFLYSRKLHLLLMRRRPITHRGQTSSGYCVGSSRRELVRSTSAAAAAMLEIAAAPSAARAADHSAVTSPTFGDSATTARSLLDTGLALAGAFPMEHGKTTRAVEFLLFNVSPETVSDLHHDRFSGAM